MSRDLFNHAVIHLIASVAVAMMALAAIAADGPAQTPPAVLDLPSPAEPPQPSEPPRAGAGGSIQSGLPGCAVWTDRCVICQRDGGVIACSNIGIACQPQAMLCLRAEAAEQKKPEN